MKFASGLFLAVALLAGCQNMPPAGGQLAAPTFGTLQIPDPSGGNNWTTYSPTSPAAEVLPVRGRAVRVWLYAAGNTFTVSLKELDGTVTMLPQNYTGTQPPPEAGFFQIVDQNVNTNPPIWVLYVRAPQALMDPANYDIWVVHQSVRTDVADSNPMILSLRQRKVYTVSVMVNGNGHVTSNPAGIQCGSAASGAVLTPCSYEFGPGTVSLNPGSNDLNTTKFIGWSGNCAPGVQVCTFTLTGMAPIAATATFGASTVSVPVSACPAAPLLPGLRWVDIPSCATGVLDQHPGITNPAICDGAGYFCCEPGPMIANAPRCGGMAQIESTPDCGVSIQRILRQPGGCYEIDAFP